MVPTPPQVQLDFSVPGVKNISVGSMLTFSMPGVKSGENSVGSMLGGI
jgi:hypothetical protein